MTSVSYHKRSKKDKDVKEAMWKAYGRYCPICKEYLRLADLTIDRIIPENQKKLSSETLEYYNKLCEDGFSINCLENYMPMHIKDNIEKGDKDLGVYQFEHRLLTAKNKVKMVLINLQEKKIIRKKDTLICELGKLADNNEAEFIYYYLTKQSQQFERKRIITDGYKHYHCTFTEKNVAVFFNIPKTFKEEASCLVTFTSLTISGCLITLNQEQIHDILFSSTKTDHLKACRKFILFPDINNKEQYFVQLGNNRFTLAIEELKQLCEIIDDLYNEYIKVFLNIEKTIGTIGYEYNKEVNGYRLVSMSKQLWNLLFEYSWKYDWANGEGSKYIFNKTGLQILVNSPYTNQRFKNGIHTILHPVEGTYSVDVYWKEGFSPLNEHNSLDAYNPDQKWRCDYTYEWLMKELIPVALYESYIESLSIKSKLLRKKLDFQAFKESINYRNFNLYRFISSAYKLETADDKKNLLYYFADIKNLIKNYGQYIYFEYDELVSLLNVCNILAVIFKNNPMELKLDWPCFNITRYINNINNIYDKIDSIDADQDLNVYQVCELLDDACEIMGLEFINLSENIIADIKYEIIPFDKAIKKILLVDKYH